MFTAILVSFAVSTLIAMFVFPSLLEINESLVAQKEHTKAMEEARREIDNLIDQKVKDLRQAVIEEGIVCKMYHEFPMYWPTKK